MMSGVGSQTGINDADATINERAESFSNYNNDELINISVMGREYVTFRKTLETFPNTLLGNPERRQNYFYPSKGCYFFDRSCKCFDAILYFYQTGGVLIKPDNVPLSMFVIEVEFFDLGKDAVSRLMEKEGDTRKEKPLPLPKHAWQKRIWLLFEDPYSSIEARVLATWSIFVIAASIIIFCMESMPAFQTRTPFNNTDGSISYTTVPRMLKAEPWFTLELFCIVWFTIEYTSRFICAPSRWKFFISFLNMLDLMTILPYFVLLTVTSKGMAPVLRALRLIRVFRIFKFSRHSHTLQILGQTLRASLSELGMLVFFLCIGVVLFSSFIYYVEKDNSDMFQSIPDAFWYAVVTMTTVGYGDKAPKNAFGKLVGSLCALSGVLTIALPVPVIASNFKFFYDKHRVKDAKDEEACEILLSSEEIPLES